MPTLAALASLPTDAPSERAALYLPDLPATRHILIAATGRQHVALRAGDRALQLAIEGADITEHAVSLVFMIEGNTDLRRSSSALADFTCMLPGRRPRKPALMRGSPQIRRLRDTIIALDGHQVKASYRQIAEVILGVPRVRRDWRRGDLKFRVRRHVTRGVALTNGKYRDLLR